jgi:hyperosmotically inducible protein
VTVLQVSVVVLMLGACASTVNKESAGEFLDNSMITAKVKSKLIDDPVTSAFSIKVESFKGIVQLSGFVSSEKEKIRAEQIARAVEGIKDVKNDLIIKGN